jgi:hypothetical protein
MRAGALLKCDMIGIVTPSTTFYIVIPVVAAYGHSHFVVPQLTDLDSLRYSINHVRNSL